MEQPKYILKFNEGLMRPKKESRSIDIVKAMLGICLLLSAFGILLLGTEIFEEIIRGTGVCIFIAVGYLIKQGGYVRTPSPCELWFFDDYLVQYCSNRYYNRKNIRKEYYKFYYRDIKRCVYRTVANKIDIYGMLETTFYKYDKNGNVSDTPCKHKIVDSISVFYTVFEPNIDFIKEIEEHSPIHMEYENS